ncbi:hypothetical protein [Bacteroides cellulosilyticus]|uniref:hypothetical protein n=1 Tax=Bacteroides cellulosilyticus TaxID=246787 RepID=UPI00356899B4
MNDFLKILSREVDNPDRIYLYFENGNWYAYEHSACRLKQVLSECCIQQVISLTYQVVLVRAQISGQHLENELGDFLTASPAVSVCDTHIEIPFRWQSPVIFDRWKQMELAMQLPCVELENV